MLLECVSCVTVLNRIQTKCNIVIIYHINESVTITNESVLYCHLKLEIPGQFTHLVLNRLVYDSSGMKIYIYRATKSNETIAANLYG